MTTLSTTNVCLQSRQRILCQSLSLHVSPGEIIGIIGENGSGKSTLLHTLAGLQAPHAGTVFINNQSLKNIAVKTLAQYRGILFQDSHLALPLTVHEYCSSSRYPHQSFLRRHPATDKKLIDDALTQMELAHLRHIAVTQLSGGEKRRLAIAGLLIQSPSIYLLDEPTNHLDVRHQINVMQHLQQLAVNERKSIVMTLHDIRLARAYCQRILLLFPDGHTAFGTPQSMLTPANLSQLYRCDVSAILY